MRDRHLERPRRTSRLPGEPRVALIHDWLTGMRGGEKCLEVLCRRFPNATLHTLLHDRGSVSSAIEGMRIRTSPLQKIPGIAKHYRGFLPLMPWAANAWEVGDVDLVVSFSHCVAKAVRVPAGVPHVCYCFTPMRYAWEGRTAYLHRWENRPIRKMMAQRLLDQLQAWDRATSSGVTQFVAISQTVRERIRRCYARESIVIPPPVDTEFYTPDSSIKREPYYLCVSALVPYKRIDQAVEACGKLGRRLVVIGKGPSLERLRAQREPFVEFLGWQSDEVIRDHLRRCSALIFPGEEDFGIVPVEALACGTPVIALGRGGVAETINEEVGLLYNEPSVSGLAAAIEQWEIGGRAFDETLAVTRAARFATEVYENQLVGLLEEVLGRRESTHGTPRPHQPRSPGYRESTTHSHGKRHSQGSPEAGTH